MREFVAWVFRFCLAGWQKAQSYSQQRIEKKINVCVRMCISISIHWVCVCVCVCVFVDHKTTDTSSRMPRRGGNHLSLSFDQPLFYGFSFSRKPSKVNMSARKISDRGKPLTVVHHLCPLALLLKIVILFTFHSPFFSGTCNRTVSLTDCLSVSVCLPGRTNLCSVAMWCLAVLSGSRSRDPLPRPLL